ncbi:MAG: hypothetical protein Rhims3KO_26240 [Hyphomicrobiales bacterium]
MTHTKTNSFKKSFVRIALAGTVLATGLVGVALADDRGDRDRERGGHSSFQAGERFARADVNGDRMLSAEEFTTQGLERFTNADADGDGLVTAEEMIAARTQAMEERDVERSERRAERRTERMQARTERMIERLDADEDGAVSLEEATAASEAMFARLDRDDDGSLEPSELRRGFRGGDRGDRDGERRQRGERFDRGQDRPADDASVIEQSL